MTTFTVTLEAPPPSVSFQIDLITRVLILERISQNHVFISNVDISAEATFFNNSLLSSTYTRDVFVS